MKKIMLAILLSLLMITSVFAANAIIGTGTGGSGFMPTYGNYNYSWSHFILPGNAITSAVDITSLEFEVNNTPSNYIMNNQTVYMRLTTETTVTTAYTADLTSYTQVYSGSVTWNGGGWQGINLTTPFTYNGTSNIEIIWENRAGICPSGYPSFRKTDFNNAGAYKYLDANFPVVPGTVGNFYPNTRVSWLVPGEPATPVLVAPAHNATNLALATPLSWTTGANTTNAILYLATNAEFTGATLIDPATSPSSPTLAYSSSYFWKVKAVGPTGVEAFSTVRKFTTLLDPATPTAPTLVAPANAATNVALNAPLSWTINAENTSSSVIYLADNADFTGATIIPNVTSPYSPTLANGIKYYWKVLAVGSTGIEVASTVRNFTTKPAPIASFPWTETFTTWPAQHWTQFSGVLAATTPMVTATNWYHRAFGYIGSTYNSAYMEIYGTKNHWLVSPSINLDASTEPLQLTFDIALTTWNNTSANALGINDLVAVVISTDDGLTWSNANVLQDWANGDPISNTGDSYAISLAGYSGLVKIGLYASRTTGTTPDLSIYFDNVQIREEPAGALVEISPATKDFGNLLQNAVIATPTTFTISNSGVAAATINEIALVNATYFTMTDTNAYPFTLAAGATMTLGVTPKTDLVGIHNTFLRVKRVDPGNPFAPIEITAPLTVNILDSTGNDHNNPLILNVENQIVVNHTTAPYQATYAFCSGPSVVYKLTLPASKIIDISLSGTAWDTKMWVFNSFDDINTATVNGDAWYYNDDEGSAGTGGGRFAEIDKTRDRATWSKMNPSFALAGDYFIVVSGYSSNSGAFTMTVNSANIPAPALATSPFPATTAENQPSALTLAWTNAQYTETVDVYFGVAGSMVMVQNNVPAINQYAVTELATATTYEWKVVNRNASGISTAPATTWSFTTIANAPVAATYTAPTNAGTNIAVTGNLTWGAVTGADGYKVYFSEDINFADVVTPVVQTTTSYAYNGDFATTYFWKVIPYNVIGDATGTIATWSFTTAPSPFPMADLIFDGVRAVNHGMPIEPYSGYSMTQNIYQQAELNIENSAITSISYLYNKNSAWTETVEIYMKHTTKDTFSGTSDWEVANFTHVFSGIMSVNTTESVVTFNLDVPFVYNNTDNLLVAFFATETGYKSSNDEFFNYPVVGNRSLRIGSDSNNYHTTFPATVPSGTLKAFRPVTGFNYQALTAEAQFAVSAETLTFVDQEMGMVSDPQMLTVSNLGLADLGITGLALAGTNADQFQLTDTNGYPVTLATAENMTVQVVYAPTTAGDHTASLQITDNQARVVNTVQLVGNSLDPNIYEINIPYSQGFENPVTLLGWNFNLTSTSTSAKADVYNSVSSAHSGNYSLRFYHPSSTHTTEAEAISPVVVPNMDTYRVRFWAKKSNSSNSDPLLIGKYDAAMETFTQISSLALTTTYAEYTVDMLVANRANERFAFKYATSATTYQYFYIDDVTFEAIPLTALAELSVTAVDFGDVPVLATSTTRTVSIKNVGVGALTITDVAITGADAAMFAWTYAATEPNMALANNESLTINVTFTPASAGDKVATLVITDDLGRTFRVNSATKATNNNRNANIVTLTGNGWVPPQGSTCSNPLPLTFPANITDNTIHYGDDYESAMIAPSSGYMGGDDVVYQFTFANSMVLNGSIVTPGTWIGAFILENEPNVASPAPVTHSNTAAGNTLNYYDVFIPAGTYYLIISSYPAPQNIAYTINLTADPLPIPGAATTPSPAIGATDQATALTLAWTNANYTETVDLWLGVAGARDMALVLSDVAAVDEYEVTGLAVNTVYNWKVVNRNYTGETATPATWSFTTVGSAPAAVTYTVPANAATNVALSGNLSWGASVGAEGYRVYLSTDNTFASVTPVEQTTLTHAYSALAYNTTYYWKVLPYNIVGEPTEGVAVWSFTTMASPFPDATVVFDGARVTSPGMPMDPYFGYTVTQNIYKQSELNMEDLSITSISYLYNNYSAWSETIEIYMGHTSKDVFANTSDWITSGLTHVYSGTLNATTSNPIVNIELDTPFDYNNSDNLVVVFYATQTGYKTSSEDFYCYSVVGNRSLLYRSDSVNAYSTWPNINVIGGLSSYLPVTGFNFELVIADPEMPINLVISMTANAVLITWDAADNANSYNVYACDTPDGIFTLIDNVEDPEYTATAADMMKFYKVKASSEPVAPPSKGFNRRGRN